MLKQEEQVAGILEETHSKNAAQSSSVGQKQAASLCTLLGSGNLLEAYSSPLHFILYGILQVWIYWKLGVEYGNKILQSS